MARGKLIVIDGTDGSGKATQVALLRKKIQQEGKKVEWLDFPRYEENFMGRFIGECLAGKHGDFAHADPHMAALLYAVDRYESKNKIEKWLRKGTIVVLDRYVSANQIHQGGKIKNEKERKAFFMWIEQLEFGVFGLPRPDAILYLDVPLTVTQRLVREKDQQRKKVYLKQGEKDVVEHNLAYVKASHKSARSLIRENRALKTIDCAPQGKLLPREVITEMVWLHVKKVL